MKLKTIILIIVILISSFVIGRILNFEGNFSEEYDLDVGKSRDQNPDNIFNKSDE